MNNSVISNYSKLKVSLFFLPLLFLFVIFIFLYKNDCLNIHNYTAFQKNYFYSINSKLSQFPQTLENLTQLGDELIMLSFLCMFILLAPAIWESLISASLISAIISFILKRIFAVPRPAAVFDPQTFTIIGNKLSGNTSFPSGHSITVFTILSVLLFAFMPQKLNNKLSWMILVITIGLMLAFTRVGVGAHYPIDVVVGSIIGYISGIAGILINQKYKIWRWVNDKKYYPVFIFLLLIGFISVFNKLFNENLIIYYFSLISLSFSQYKIITAYVKK